MDNAAKRRVTTVEFEMRRGVGRRTIFPFHHLTAHIDHHHIVCFHGFVGDAADKIYRIIEDRIRQERRRLGL